MIPVRAARGRTRPGRLRGLDAWCVAVEGRSLQRWAAAGAWAVDYGVGDRPDTTLEWAAALRAVAPSLGVVAVDAVPARVASAAPALAAAGVCAAVGCFGEPPAERGPLALVRAMNLLRAHPPGEARALLGQMVGRTAPGGVVWEGSTCPRGAVLVAQRRVRGGVGEGLLFWTDFGQGFGPLLFKDRLPVGLRAEPAVERFFEAWGVAFTAARRLGEGPEAGFRRAGAALQDAGLPVQVVPGLAGGAGLWWAPLGGLPELVPR